MPRPPQSSHLMSELLTLVLPAALAPEYLYFATSIWIKATAHGLNYQNISGIEFQYAPVIGCSGLS